MNFQNNSSELIILTKEQVLNLFSQLSENKQPEYKEPEKVFLNSKEVQEFLSIGHSTMHRYINEGKLKPVRFGRKLLFDRADLIATAKRYK